MIWINWDTTLNGWEWMHVHIGFGNVATESGVQPNWNQTNYQLQNILSWWHRQWSESRVINYFRWHLCSTILCRRNHWKIYMQETHEESSWTSRHGWEPIRWYFHGLLNIKYPWTGVCNWIMHLHSPHAQDLLQALGPICNCEGTMVVSGFVPLGLSQSRRSQPRYQWWSTFCTWSGRQDLSNFYIYIYIYK